ncbi:MAG: hypothetical protein MJ236_01775 [Clostridia bacterium]|nr:hypothetical protein [Clostridia bacterium]
MRYAGNDYVNLLTYGGQKPFFSELMGPIIGLADEWRAQGATEDLINLTGFAFDYVQNYRLGNFEAINMYDEVVIRDDAEYKIFKDGYGRTMKIAKSTATIPLPMDYPVETMDDWLKIKHMFEYSEERVTDAMLEEAIAKQKLGFLIRCEIFGGFDILRELMGEENCCISFYEDEELCFDILNTISETNVKMLKKITSRIHIDQLSIHEDMAGKTGPLIGPNLVEKFLKPYYLASWDIVRNAGTKLFVQDSDGDMKPLIDTFIECGVNVIYPCEPNGGMDIVELRKKYGHKIAFAGGIDKFVLKKTKKDIEAEVDYKMQDIMMDGGIIYGLDHRIPNGTPLENYIHYVNYARQKLGLEPYEKAEKGWGRMAL